MTGNVDAMILSSFKTKVKKDMTRMEREIILEFSKLSSGSFLDERWSFCLKYLSEKLKLYNPA